MKNSSRNKRNEREEKILFHFNSIMWSKDNFLLRGKTSSKAISEKHNRYFIRDEDFIV